MSKKSPEEETLFSRRDFVRTGALGAALGRRGQRRRNHYCAQPKAS